MARTPQNSQRPRIATDRLGWRLPEWMRLTGTSRPTLWRQIKRGDLKIVSIGSTRMVPRSEAVRLGFINE
jgi:predicted DNA-binding transcriptional regulator AlpA